MLAPYRGALLSYFCIFLLSAMLQSFYEYISVLVWDDIIFSSPMLHFRNYFFFTTLPLSAIERIDRDSFPFPFPQKIEE